jgi:hypothetical protein
LTRAAIETPGLEHQWEVRAADIPELITSQCDTKFVGGFFVASKKKPRMASALQIPWTEYSIKGHWGHPGPSWEGNK